MVISGFGRFHRWLFVKQFSNIIDLLSILPFYFGLILGDRNNSRFFVILRVLRVTRVLKISKFSAEKMEQHGSLLKQNKGELTPRGGSSRFSDRCINRKCEVTIGTVGATERRRREHLGVSGGMLPQEIFEI